MSAQEHGTLPFSERELAEALSARAPGLETSDLRVEPAGGLFVVSLGPKARVVDLAGSTGVDAARVVALVAYDLSLLELNSVLPQPAPPAPSPPPKVSPASPAAAGLRADIARLGVEGSLQRGLLREDTWSFTLGLEAAVITSKLLTTLNVGYWSAPSARSAYTETQFSYDALRLRLGVGIQEGRYTIALGPVYAHYWVGGGRGHVGDLFGASLQCAMWLPAAARVRLGVGVFFDVYPRRALFYAGGDEPVLVTPAWALGVALSLALGWA